MESNTHYQAKNIIVRWIQSGIDQARALGGESLILWGLEFDLNSEVDCEYPIMRDQLRDGYIQAWRGRVPRYCELEAMGTKPICILDVAVISKGKVTHAFEVTKTSYLAAWKFKLLETHSVKTIEVYAHWITKQLKRPQSMKAIVSC